MKLFFPQDQHLGDQQITANQFTAMAIKVWQSFKSQQAMVSVIRFAYYRLASEYFTLVKDEMEKRLYFGSESTR